MNTPSPAISDRAWVGTRKGLFELRRRGGAWAVERVSFAGDPVSQVLPPDAQGRMLAALNLGHFGVKVHASDDAGATWREVATPTYPAQPPEATGFAWKLVLIWSLERDRQGRLWAGTLPGGLFRSDDFGASWQLNEALWQRPERQEWAGGGYPEPGIHSICPHPERDGEMLVALSSGGMWKTTDDGASWQVKTQGLWADYMPPERAEDPNMQDPHRVVRCPAAPDVLWCQHHGGIWFTRDNAERWERLHAPLSSFGFAVEVHPREPATAWFVPAVADMKRVPVDAALAVNRTRDFGAHFDTLRRGLPQQHAYDLVYRHGLAVAPDGEQLLMTSTSGGLWSSGDGGEHWTAVPARLPPAVVVRFG